MGYFLNEARRHRLIETLTKLTMPHHLAEKFASFSDNLAEIDANLAEVTQQASKYADQISQLNPKTDGEEGKILVMFINADIAIIRAYKEEILSRKLSPHDFPGWISATNDGLDLTNKAVIQVRRKIGQDKTVH